ncbi:NAD(P)/FAD-dependent oxidoreductase [Roseivirga sp. BDSF3-8]|uniref:NAD(P)/FAD-dependent oxidoreductase n=1 Tax=Roseivirga sp. BDSF3-8 TaxID=3241598 RepID=UPI00353227D1
MNKTLNIVLSPSEAFNPDQLEPAIKKKARVSPDESVQVRLLKRSIDARQKNIKVNIQALISDESLPPRISYRRDYPDVSKAPEAIIVGAGPAGMFAALRLIELGIKPVLLERGKDVRARRRDLAAINKKHIVNPNSNYCFGEGGAGTYSDGKLYTRSKKRGDVQRILEILVAHGAREEILIDAHPHIGTNKLPRIVADLRESILEAGGEVRFNARVTDLVLSSGSVSGVILAGGEKISGVGVILATGHSARDIFDMLQRQEVEIEAKPFALGVRVEHNQELIDSIQYHTPDRGPWLPASSYSLVQQVSHDRIERGVFSFCMCPGGFIVPAATAPGEIVVNGMSPSRRDSKYANSGIVVAVHPEDLPDYQKFGKLSALRFQQDVEQKAFIAGGSTQVAPAQRLVDFTHGKVSASLPDTSYQPGLASTDLNEVLPGLIAKRLASGFQSFGRKMRGYFTNEAQIVGVESRTSSPVQIPRDRQTFEHTRISRLYPCGEGAGYAGGIVSAAMDGERCAEKLAAKYGKSI